MVDETKLIGRLLARDKSAAREFYILFMPKLLRFIRRRVANENDVEEIAQDSLFAFLEKARDFTGKSSLSTYLCSIAQHKIVDFYRKQKLKRIVFSQLPQGLEFLFSDSTDPQKIFEERLRAHKIKGVLGKLAPHYAKILRMKYIEGRSVGEIAWLFSCSLKAAESILFRARKAFAKLYAE